MHICCVYVIYDNEEKFSFLQLGYVPIGLSYISGALKQAGHTTEGLFSKARGSIDGLLDKLEKKPDIFAVCIPSAYAFPKVQEILDQIRKRFKDVKIVIGGLYPTLCPDIVILNKNIDALCIGEGEKAIVEYAKQVQNNNYAKTDNLWIKNNLGILLKCDQSIFVEDIDRIPMDRTIWKKWFDNHNSNKYFIVIQRGCPNRCLYCVNSAFAERSQGQYLRYRNIDSVLEELKTLKQQYPKMKTIEFNADNAFADMNYFTSLFNALKKFNETQSKKYNFEITGNCANKFLLDNKNLAEYLKDINVTKVSFSLESGSLEIRKIFNRPYYTNEDIIHFCKTLKKENIEIIISAMYCYPFETYETYKETIQCIKKANPDRTQLAFLRGFSNTQFGKYILENDIPPITLKDAYRYIKMAIALKISVRRILSFIKDIKSDFVICRMVLKNQKYKNLAKFYFDKADFKKAIKFFNELLKNDTSGWIYGDLAIAKMNIKDYQGAIDNFDRVLKYDNISKAVYEAKREECIKILGLR